MLIKNINVLTGPYSGMICDIYLQDGLIARIDESAGGQGDRSAANDIEPVIDGTGLYAAPGFVDLHVHFRDPGSTDKEDIFSGSKAAAHGGFTTVCCMPNTKPAIDDLATLLEVDKRGREADLANLLAVSAITRGQSGSELAPFKEMDAADTLCRALTGHGVAGISEDGRSLMDEDLMRLALQHAKALGIPVMDHPEDSSLTGGCINEGIVAEKLDVAGIPAKAELNIVLRDIRLAEETGARIHLQHISCAECVSAIREAKKNLPDISAETAPHYFSLTEDAVVMHGANAKMNPPLRTERDRLAVIEGLSDGTIDIIATDHAPHRPDEKDRSLAEAPFGIIGLETAFSVAYTNLVMPGYLSMDALIEAMSGRPAALIGLDRGIIAEGKIADVTIFDIDEAFRVDRYAFASKATNSPYHDQELFGRIYYTIKNGKLTYDLSNNK